MAESSAKLGGKGPVLWLQGLACGALLAFAAPTLLMMTVFGAPALACFAADTEPGRGMTRAVAVSCGAGALSPLWHLWMAHDRMEVALASVGDLWSLTLAWGGGACAWALCQILPAMLQSFWNLRESLRARAIEEELKQLRDEWHVG
jgi:hypothetical protein